MSSSQHQLLLLADHLKLSLLERQRAISLNLEPTKQDGHILRSLSQLQQGLESLEPQDAKDPEVIKLQQQYADLYAQFYGSAPPTTNTKQPNDPALAPDFAAVQSRPPRRNNRNVRFRDDPDEEDAEEQATRAALFADQERYTDEAPSRPDHNGMDNQQIHSYNKQVLREQDEHLDVLGQSIGRQRILGIQMGSELDEQNELLDDVERGVDRHTNTLTGAQRRLGTIARKSRENWNWITIGILIIVLILVIVILK